MVILTSYCRVSPWVSVIQIASPRSRGRCRKMQTVGPWKWPIYSGFTSLPSPFSGRVELLIYWRVSSCIIFFVGASKQWEYTAMLGSCANSWIANNIDPENSWESSVARGREYSNPHNWQSLTLVGWRVFLHLWSFFASDAGFDTFVRLKELRTPAIYLLVLSREWGNDPLANYQ